MFNSVLLQCQDSRTKISRRGGGKIISFLCVCLRGEYYLHVLLFQEFKFLPFVFKYFLFFLFPCFGCVVNLRETVSGRVKNFSTVYLFIVFKEM